MFKFTDTEKRVLKLLKKRAKKKNPFIFAVPQELEGLAIKSDKTLKDTLRLFYGMGLIEYDTTSRRNPLIKVK